MIAHVAGVPVEEIVPASAGTISGSLAGRTFASCGAWDAGSAAGLKSDDAYDSDERRHTAQSRGSRAQGRADRSVVPIKRHEGGQVLGPHPGRPDSRSPTAMSFAVVSSLYPYTRSTALEESSP